MDCWGEALSAFERAWPMLTDRCCGCADASPATEAEPPLSSDAAVVITAPPEQIVLRRTATTTESPPPIGIQQADE